MSVATVLAITTAAPRAPGIKPVSVARGFYLSTGGTLTFKSSHRDDAQAVVFAAGYHPGRLTEITNMGACVGIIYW